MLTKASNQPAHFHLPQLWKLKLRPRYSRLTLTWDWTKVKWTASAEWVESIQITTSVSFHFRMGSQYRRPRGGTDCQRASCSTLWILSCGSRAKASMTCLKIRIRYVLCHRSSNLLATVIALTPRMYRKWINPLAILLSNSQAGPGRKSTQPPTGARSLIYSLYKLLILDQMDHPVD